MRDAGWADLTNARAAVKVDGREVELRRRRRPARPAATATTTSPARPTPDADLALGVVHAPYHRVVDRMAADGFPLVLAGHTHGGQLARPVLRRPGHQLRPRPRAAPRGCPGTPTRTWLHVSAGLGTSPYAPDPLRLPARGDPAHPGRRGLT